ncbi:MAG: hypothetical protein B0A82_07885 [Alkalinema sp. CACIAM 70d]|nr:MAG: hypothetical protein B0A82_07885 [Alkalinema sp. CACIAM 70d]
MSHTFRELLRKIGSGPHTGENLTRSEAEAATRMMLLQEATPAQIGAFMIAHRIKRPTGEELAGMLDAYDGLSDRLQPITAKYPVLVMCSPYDGRSRTAPFSVLTALVLAAAEVPVVLHGGDRMPTKEGVPLVELWASLGIDWRSCSLGQVQQLLQTTRIGFFYLPQHFPLAAGLVPYRDQIGKRPPFSTLELMWSPYVGEQQLICGFVHPPTENMFRAAFELRGTLNFTTVKGLEGSCDLPRDRTAIIGLNQASGFDRLHLSPRDYGFAAKEVAIAPTEHWSELAKMTLQGNVTELTDALIWNSGFYLWRMGAALDLPTGLQLASTLLTQGKVAQVWHTLQISMGTV